MVRYVANHAGGPRARIDSVGGQPHFEAPQLPVAVARSHPVLRLRSDFGAIGWPGLQWLLHNAYLRGTWIVDLAQHCMSDVKGAQASAGLRAAVLEA